MLRSSPSSRREKRQARTFHQENGQRGTQLLDKEHRTWKMQMWLLLMHVCAHAYCNNTKQSQGQADKRTATRPPSGWSLRRLWALRRATMASSADSAILPYLPLTTGNKVFPMPTNDVTALGPRTEEGRCLLILSSRINESQGGFNNNFSSCLRCLIRDTYRSQRDIMETLQHPISIQPDQPETIRTLFWT